MRSFGHRSLGVALLVASGGMLAGGIALGPVVASGRPIMIGPFAVVNCSNTTACQTYKNASTGAGLQSESAKGTALIGIAASAGNGVHGSSLSGSGVSGTTNKGVGVAGKSTSGFGLSGVSSSSDGVFGLSAGSGTVAGVAGVSTNGYGVSAVSTNSFGLWASSQSTAGVYGKSGTSNGVFGTSNTGVGVFGAANAQAGVEGSSSSGDGVFATSSSGYGLEADSSKSDAVHAFNSGTGTAVNALATNGDAIDANTTSGVALYALTGIGTVIVAATAAGDGADIEGGRFGIIGRAGSGGGNNYPLDLTDSGSNQLFYVDDNGNVFYHGTLNPFARTPRGDVLFGYGTEATSPTVEDTGSAQLVDGSALVPLNPTFAQAIDQHNMYKVMLTPDGDTRGLYVASKSPTGFVVREVQGGRGSLTFDYHIYGVAQGHAGEHMTVVPAAMAHGLMPDAPKPHLPGSKRARH